jgi:hypothetical protein
MKDFIMGVIVSLLLVGLFSLTLTGVSAQRQLQTLREHPTERAAPVTAAPSTSSIPSRAALAGSCVLEDGTEVNVYLEPKGAQ